MNKNILLLVVMGAVFFMLALQAFQLQGINAKIDAKLTGASVASRVASANTQQGGETQEQMMARMHPDQVKKQSAAPKGLENIPSMVGGC
ncbi:hypothetical protein HYU06_02125 [Candidatus Woesearchaeota archaeon]|nr:hypothetical protein [Candidatus Woesearchaeota archaeon]